MTDLDNPANCALLVIDVQQGFDDAARCPGNAFKSILDDVEPALLVAKQVHSAFHGDVDLDLRLRENKIRELVICGIQTNVCCETTARVAGDLGYDVRFALDATHTFDAPAIDGAEPLPATLCRA